MAPIGPDDPTPPSGVPGIPEETPTRPEMLGPCPERCGRRPACPECRGTGEVTRPQLRRWLARRGGRPPKDEE